MLTLRRSFEDSKTHFITENLLTLGNLPFRVLYLVLGESMVLYLGLIIGGVLCHLFYKFKNNHLWIATSINARRAAIVLLDDI